MRHDKRRATFGPAYYGRLLTRGLPRDPTISQLQRAARRLGWRLRFTVTEEIEP